MSIDKVSKSSAKLDKKVITIKDNQGNEQQVKLSVFTEGMAIAADTSSALSLFDKNKDGKISSEEAYDIKKSIYDYAGRDKVLDDEEILKMLNVTDKTNKTRRILNHFKTMVERQFKGNLETTVKTNDGRTIKSNFNSDGSGTTVTTAANGTVTTCTYDAGKVLKKKEIVDTEGKKTVIEYDYDGGDKPSKVTTKLYNKIGRLKEKTTVQNHYNEDGKLESSETSIKTAGKKERKLTTEYKYDTTTGKLTDSITEEHLGSKPIILPNGNTAERKKTTSTHYDYDSKGNLSKKTTTKKPGGVAITAEFKDGKIQKQTTTEQKISFKIDNGKLRPSYTNSSSVMEYSYYPNGNKKEVTIHGKDSYGKSSDSKYEYDENGKITSASKSYYKRGVYVEEKYEGPNLANRVAGGVASEVIEYEDAKKTKIKQRTVNIFDKDGILIGDEIFEGNGKKVGEHNFSQLDGKFDTAYQKGRGDCYLLAAINSLANSEAGGKLLNDIISQEGENFVISFPGAKLARENLIKDLKSKNPNFNESKIRIPDKYTITPKELREAMLKSGAKYSIGDKDVLLLEIAYEKYREAVAETLDENKLKPSEYMKRFNLNLNGDDYLSAGTGSEAIFILTGKTSEVYLTNDMKNVPVCYIDSDFQMHITDSSGNLQSADSGYKAISAATTANNKNLIEKLKRATVNGTIQNYAATAGFRVSSQEVNGKVIKGGNHALTIKRVTDNEVVLANPWNPEKDVVMSMEDFLKSAYMIEVADLNANRSENPVGNNNGNVNIVSNNNHVSQTPPPQQNNENTTKYKVKENDGYIRLLKRELQKQGIAVTPDNIKKASEQFKKANPGAVKLYNGSVKKWKGNEYLIAGTTVNIPQFKIR